MVRRQQICGYSEDVVFGEQQGMGETVFKLEVDSKTGDSIKTELFKHAKPLIAIQTSSKKQLENQYLNTTLYFYIMDIDQKSHLVRVDSDKVGQEEIEETLDYSSYPLEKLA